jgi:hypothetical protein
LIWISLFALAGAIFWIAAINLWRRERRLASHGVRASGEVVRIEEVADTEGEPQFLRVVNFIAVGGKTIEFTDSIPSRDKAAYARNKRVTVLYDRNHFAHARIDPGGMRISGYIFLFVMGLCFIAFACAGFVLGR